VDILRDVQEAAIDFEYPDAWIPGRRPPRRGHPTTVRPRPEEARRPFSTSAAVFSMQTRAGASSSPSWDAARDDFDGQTASLRLELHFGWPGMHGEVVELA
jgi:hypothetical protein